MIKKIILSSVIAQLSVGFGLNSFAQDQSDAVQAVGKIAAAAKAFLATLGDAQRGKVVYDFKDDEQRHRWSNLPVSFVKRGGLRLGDLTQPQREAAMAVLAAALSPQGYEKAVQIVEGDEILKKTDHGRGGPGGLPVFE